MIYRTFSARALLSPLSPPVPPPRDGKRRLPLARDGKSAGRAGCGGGEAGGGGGGEAGKRSGAASPGIPCFLLPPQSGRENHQKQARRVHRQQGPHHHHRFFGGLCEGVQECAALVRVQQHTFTLAFLSRGALFLRLYVHYLHQQQTKKEQ